MDLLTCHELIKVDCTKYNQRRGGLQVAQANEKNECGEREFVNQWGSDKPIRLTNELRLQYIVCRVLGRLPHAEPRNPRRLA